MNLGADVGPVSDRGRGRGLRLGHPVRRSGLLLHPLYDRQPGDGLHPAGSIRVRLYGDRRRYLLGHPGGAGRGEGQPALRHDPGHPRGGTADLPR